MIRYREILRLADKGLSQREIARSCGCAKSTVADVMERARKEGVLWPLADDVSDTVLSARLYPKKQRADAGKCPIDFESIDKELGMRGTTRALLWQEYRDGAESLSMEPYSYVRFCELLRQWRNDHAGSTMHIEHKAGFEMQVDWVGMTGELIDPDTAELVKVYVFIACLPFSGLIFARGFTKTDEAAWIEAHIAAFEFFGGVTPIITPDNAKTAVTKHTKDELILNEQYRKMAEHYGCVIVPARPRRPKDKASVEMVARVIEQQAIAPLRHVRFFSLEAFNEALAQKVDEINARPFQKRPGSRAEIFDRQEKDLLIALPPVPFEMVTRKIARVQLNYHISFDKRMYSVDHSYVGKQVEVVATKDTVSVFYQGARIALHRRSFGPEGSYVTSREHMPNNHKDHAPWDRGRFLSWASKIGECTKKVTEAILDSRPIEQHAYRSVNALLHLADKYGRQALEKACGQALARTSYPSYKLVKELVRDLPAAEDALSSHAFVRGADYYNDL